MAIWVSSVDAISGAPLFTGRGLREPMSIFSTGATSAKPFGCRSGVRPGTPSTTVTATSTTWTIGAHAGILDLQSAAEASGYAYAINAVGGLPTGAVTAADATRPRIDLVWLRIDDPTESDGSSVPAVVAGYTAGAPLASPVPPATPARCMVLAWINVPMSGGGSPTVTWKAPMAISAGGVVPAADSTFYPATPYVGQYIDDATLGLLRWNGTAWTGSAAPRQHMEFTAAAMSIPNASQWGVGVLSVDGTNSTTPAIATAGTNLITITAAGLYAVSFVGAFVSSVSGRSFININAAGVDVARSGMIATETLASASEPNLVCAAAATITFTAFQSSGAAINMTSRIRLTKISA